MSAYLLAPYEPQADPTGFGVRYQPTLAPLAQSSPPEALMLAWQRALRAGQPTRASGYRRALEGLEVEEPTWEDAAWQ